MLVVDAHVHLWPDRSYMPEHVWETYHWVWGRRMFGTRDAVCRSLYDAAVDLGIPLLFHCGPTGYPLKSRYSRPSEIESVAAEYPDLRIVMGHLLRPGLVRRGTGRGGVEAQSPGRGEQAHVIRSRRIPSQAAGPAHDRHARPRPPALWVGPGWVPGHGASRLTVTVAVARLQRRGSCAPEVLVCRGGRHSRWQCQPRVPAGTCKRGSIY